MLKRCYSVTGLALLLFSHVVRAEINVFACEPEWASLAGEIGGERVKAASATTGLQDVHHIEARPSLIAGVRKADLLICTGAGLESGWLPVLLRRANNPRVQIGAQGYMEAADYITLLDRPARVDRAAGDVHAEGNPHIQLDPENFVVIAKALAQRLAQIDPDHALEYEAGLVEFLGRWQAALDRWGEQAKPLQGLSVVVHHNAWPYLSRWLGLRRVGTLEPKPGVPPGSAHLSQMLKQLQQQPAVVIIRSPYQSPRSSEWLAERTGIPAMELPSTVGGNAAANDLFGLFDNILQQLLSVVP